MWGPSSQAREPETRTRPGSTTSGFRTPRPGGGGDAAAGDAAGGGSNAQTRTPRPASAGRRAAGKAASSTASSGSGARRERERSQSRSSRSLHTTVSNTVSEAQEKNSQARRELEVSKLGGKMLELGRRQRLPVFPPSDFQPAAGAEEPPEEELLLDYVYGYSGHLYNQMHALGSSKVMYCAAALVVVLDVENNQQQIFRGHSSCVTSLAVQRSQDLAASGQEEEVCGTAESQGDQGSKCFCCVWRINGCEEEARLHVDDRHFDALEWSEDGGLLFACVADTANEKRGQEKLYIWNYAASGHPLVKVMILNERVVGMLAHHCDPFRCSVFGFNHLVYVSCGRHEPGGLRTWGPRWTGKAPHAILCAAYVPLADADFAEEELPLAVGTSTGVIMVLQGEVVTMQVQHSNHPVSFLKSTEGSICCGGFDGRLCFLSPSSLKPFVYFEMRRAFTVLDGQEGANMHDAAVLSFILDGTRISGRIVVGTDQNGLWLCHFVGNPQTLDVKPLTLFPSGEVLGLDANPAWREEVAVSNSKGTIRFFDIVDHVVDVRSPFTCDLLRCGALRCLAFNRSGLVLAGGSERGQLVLISTPSSQQYGDEGGNTCRATELSNTTVCKAQITHVQWSSVGDWLVVGASDAKVYLFCVAIDYERARDNRPAEVEAQHVVMSVPKVLTGNTAPVTSVQFSACGNYLMSNSADNQVIFWETSSGNRCSSALAVREVHWFENDEIKGASDGISTNGLSCMVNGGADNKGAMMPSGHPWQCTLGWPVAGLWCKGRFSFRSDAPPAVWAVESAPSRALCAFTDNTRQVCLMRFPALLQTTHIKGYHGHGLQSTNLCWTTEELLMTVQDGAMLQWRVDGDGFRHPAKNEGVWQPDQQNFDWTAAEVSPSKKKQQRYFGTPAAPRASSRSASQSGSPATRDRDLTPAWAPPSGPSTKSQRSNVATENGTLKEDQGGGSKLVTRSTQTEESDAQGISTSPGPFLQELSDVGTCTENSAISDTPTTTFTAMICKDEAVSGTVQTLASLGSVDEGTSKLPTGTVIWQPEQAAPSADDTIIGSSLLAPPTAMTAQLSHTMLPPVPALGNDTELVETSYVRQGTASAPSIGAAHVVTTQGGSADYRPAVTKVPSVRAPSAERIVSSRAVVERIPSAERWGACSVPTAVPLQQRLKTAHSWRPAVICAPAQASQRLRSYSPSPERGALPPRAASPETCAGDVTAPSRVLTPRGERPARCSLPTMQVPLGPAAPGPAPLPVTPRVRATSVPMLRGPPRAAPGSSTHSSSAQGSSTPGTPRHPAFPMQARYRPVELVSYHAAGSQARSRPSRVMPTAPSAQVPLSSGLYTTPPPPAALPQVVSSRYVAIGQTTASATVMQGSLASPAAPPSVMPVAPAPEVLADSGN